jgi:hypothetical protein
LKRKKRLNEKSNKEEMKKKKRICPPAVFLTLRHTLLSTIAQGWSSAREPTRLLLAFEIYSPRISREIRYSLGNKVKSE